jgi:hypothetical protein
MASLTRSLSMSPLRARLVMRDSLLDPELRHAMLMAARCVWVCDGPRVMRRSLVRKGSVGEGARDGRGQRRAFVLLGR